MIFLCSYFTVCNTRFPSQKTVKWVFVCLSLMPFALWQPSIHLKCVLHNCHRRESFHLWNTSGGNKSRKETGVSGRMDAREKSRGATDKMCKKKTTKKKTTYEQELEEKAEFQPSRHLIVSDCQRANWVFATVHSCAALVFFWLCCEETGTFPELYVGICLYVLQLACLAGHV